MSSLDLELTTIADLANSSKILDIRKMTPLESGEFRFLVPSFQKAGRYKLTLKLAGKNFSRVIPYYVDVYALTDSDIDTRSNLGRIPSFILQSNTIILVFNILLLFLAIFLLFIKRITQQRKERWREMLSSDNRLN